MRTSRCVGVLVGRRPGVRGDRVRASSGLDHQRVVHQDPAARGVPGRRQHVRAGHVGARRRHVDAVRSEPERPGSAVEDVAEHARRVERREAQPVDRPVRCDQGTGVAVRQESVVGDGREGGGMAHGAVLRESSASRRVAVRPRWTGASGSHHPDEMKCRGDVSGATIQSVGGRHSLLGEQAPLVEDVEQDEAGQHDEDRQDDGHEERLQGAGRCGGVGDGEASRAAGRATGRRPRRRRSRRRRGRRAPGPRGRRRAAAAPGRRCRRGRRG